jgi:dTDP-4-dehydrorhamnose reductase
MRFFLLGNTGQLGWELERILAPLGEITALDFPQVDLSDADGLRQALASLSCDWMINATAYTQVDRAETEPDKVEAINATAPRILAETARRIGAAFLHFSTDYVFDGTKGAPYNESDAPNPLGVYGRTKWLGEQGAMDACHPCMILRTSCVYSLRRDCFVTRVLRAARERETLRYADDLVGSPTWARALAEVSAQVIKMAGEHPAAWMAERRGVFHAAGDGSASRLDWAREVIDLDPRKSEQRAREVLSAKAADFPAAAPRPLYSALDCAKLKNTFGVSLPPWRKALERAMEDAFGDSA